MNAFRDTWSGYLPIVASQQERAKLRPLGYDTATGKQSFAVTEPGGVLEKAADVFALEAAIVWFSLASAMVEAPESLTADEANFVLARVVELLGEVLPIAAQAVENNPAADLPLYGEAGRDIGAALRNMRGDAR